MVKKKDDDGAVELEKIVEVCKRRGIIFPTAEIYGSLSGFWDYGPLGTLMKSKIERYWRDYFVKSGDDIVEISGSVVLPEDVFEASGHLESFVDPISQCSGCKSIHRADHLIEDATGDFVEGKSMKDLTEIVKKEDIKCPSCGGKLGEVKVFNLMLKTEISPTGSQVAYLRPETAQNIFTSFRRVFHASRAKLPFGIAQLGRSFRNEISPRHFIVRVREFNQYEIEMFLDPDNVDDCPGFEEVKDVEINFLGREGQKKDGEMSKIKASKLFEKGVVPSKWLVYFMAKEMQFYQSMGIPAEALRHRHMLEEETPHYSKGNFDMEIKFDFGWKETVGNAYRGDHDLKKHMEKGNMDMEVAIDEEDGVRKVLPHVVEPSFGLERTFTGILVHCFREGEDRKWSWFQFPPKIAPYGAAIFPLMKKDGLPEKAREVLKSIKDCVDVLYDDSGSIGKRYARADEVGIPFCITIDYDSMEKGTVTIRDRDSMDQRVVKIDDLSNVMWSLVYSGESFGNIGKAME